MAVGTISGGNMPIVFPPTSGENTGNTSSGSSGGSSTSGGYTYVTDDLYYSGGYLGTLKISAIGLSVKIYQGTGSSTLAKGAGHFTDTSIWDGTVALAGHNRGVNNHFGKIHTLEIGDKITLTTKLGTRTYKVTSVSKVSETGPQCHDAYRRGPDRAVHLRDESECLPLVRPGDCCVN